MSPAATPRSESGAHYLGFLGLSLLLIAMDRWQPGSVATTLVRYAYYSYCTIWFGLKIRTGYRRRKPYWTRESWLRFLRLIALPVGALIVCLSISYFIDISPSTFGPPKSAVRAVWILVMLLLMLIGVIGLPIAIDWLAKGEPSEQFTRTRWFRRPGSSAIA